MTYTRVLTWFLLVCAFSMPGCSPEKVPPTEGSKDTISVMVSIAPQKFFVQRIGGDFVQVSVVAPANVSPEAYQVTPRQMDTFGGTDIFFLIGMPFEEELVRRLSAVFPDLLIVDSREGVPMLSASGHSHDHPGEDHDHGHSGDDPHIWLDPMRVKIQARAIASVLAEYHPSQRDSFLKNLESFETELDNLHRCISEILAPVRGRVLYVFHPSFGYFADAYGLEQRAIEFEGKSPGARRLYEIIDEIKSAGVSTLFEQPQFKAAELQSVARETGVSVVILDGLAENYLENMKDMAEKIAAHLQPTQTTGKE